MKSLEEPRFGHLDEAPEARRAVVRIPARVAGNVVHRMPFFQGRVTPFRLA